MEYQHSFGSKEHTRKISDTHKDFELYQVLMHNFLCQNIQIFTSYILLAKRIGKFWSKVLTDFGLEILRQVW